MTPSNLRARTVAIAGGGIGGLCAAIGLQRNGFDVTVFESAPEIKPLGAGLALAGNAVRALADIGIDQEVIQHGQKLKSLTIAETSGKQIGFTDAVKLTEQWGVVNNFTIHRADLHETLIALLRPGTLRLGQTVESAEQNDHTVTIRLKEGGTFTADALIAADGIHSAIRKQLLPGSLPRYSGYTCWRGVIPRIPSGVQANESIETWGKGRRFGIVPVGDNRTYWFATLDAVQSDPKMKAMKSKELQYVYKDFHDPVPEILGATPDDAIIWGDIVDLKPIRRFAFGRILLLGDAAHATTPNMGQGGNSVQCDQCFSRHSDQCFLNQS